MECDGNCETRLIDELINRRPDSVAQLCVVWIVECCVCMEYSIDKSEFASL